MDSPTQAEVQARLDSLKAKALERADPLLTEIAELLEGILIVAAKLPALPKKRAGQKKGRK